MNAVGAQLRGPGKLRTGPISLGAEGEQADAGQDGRTCLVRPKSQARMGTAEHEQDWQPYIRLMPSLLDLMTIQVHDTFA